MAQPFGGFVPMQFARNALPPPGVMTRAMARFANELISKFGCVWPGKDLFPSQARNSASDLRLWTEYVHTSRNGTTLLARVRCIPTDTTAGNPRWYLKVDGVAQDDQTHNVRCPTGVGTRLDDIFEMEQEVTVTADSFHTIDLYTDDNCRVVGWQLFEKPNPAPSVFVPLAGILPLSGILDADIDSLINAVFYIQARQRGAAFMWNADDPASPVVATTSFVSIWESTNTVGALSETDFRNTYMDEVAGTLAIPGRAWALAERTAGAGSGTVRFFGGNHAGGVDITVNNTLQIWTSDTFTLRAGSGGDTVRAHLQAPVGTTVNLYACGFLPGTF